MGGSSMQDIGVLSKAMSPNDPLHPNFNTATASPMESAGSVHASDLIGRSGVMSAQTAVTGTQVGTQVALFAGKLADYLISFAAGKYTIQSKVDAATAQVLDASTLLQFADTSTFDPSMAGALNGLAVAARGAPDAASAIATQMTVVYLGRPVGSDLVNSFAATVKGDGPDAEALQRISELALQDGAFKPADTSKDIVVHTFNNIMGFLPSEFEQTAWAQYIDNGTLTRTNAPWVIFQSYLGATNVPDAYKLPTQARFVAAQTFSDYAFGTAQMAALNALDSPFAHAARAWLSTVDSIAHAASKMQTMLSDIAQVTLIGVTPADTFAG